VKHVLLVDNFDSFTFNLYQYVGELADQVTVVRNNKIPFEKVANGEFTHIIISPGPGNPTDEAYFGGCKQLIEQCRVDSLPVLGICLGHQGIGASFGVNVVQAGVIMHGKTSTFTHSGVGLFADLPQEITAMRYHSLALDPNTMPTDLVVDATSDDKAIMAFHHNNQPIYGLQFHPESFATPQGKQLLANFLAV